MSKKSMREQMRRLREDADYLRRENHRLCVEVEALREAVQHTSAELGRQLAHQCYLNSKIAVPDDARGRR
jgi:regulator of replication initiation timing